VIEATPPAPRRSADSINRARRLIQPLAFGGMPFDGASTDPYSTRWTQTSGHPDQEIAQSSAVLRARSIDLYRNNSLAYGVVDVISQGVVGRGPRPRPLNAQAETLLRLFAAWTPQAGWDGVSTWTEQCKGITDAASLSGDVLILWPKIEEGEPPRLDLVDASRIDTPSDKTPECDTCRLGVGYDRYGRVLGYYVRKSEAPGAGGLRADFSWFPLNRNGRINARLFKRPAVGRPRQSRGLPLLTPGINRIKDVDEHSKVELRRATQAAKVHMIVKTPDPKMLADAFENAEVTGDGDQLDALLGRAYGNTPDGSIMVLGLGEDAQTVTPPQTNGGVGDYHKAQLREIAGCTGFPAEEAFRDYSGLNYSNARTIRLMSKAAYRLWRDAMETAVCSPTWTILVQYWWASGALGRIPWSADLVAVQWDWDEMEWVDPAKEVKANAEAVETNQKSLQDICAAQGKDWRVVIAQNVEAAAFEAELRAKVGLPPKGAASAPAQAPPVMPEDPNDSEDPEDV